MLAAGVVLAASGALADTTVLVNVNVIPMSTDTVLFQQTVIIVDGKISEVGHVDAISIPKNAALIDGTERFLGSSRHSFRRERNHYYSGNAGQGRAFGAA